MSRMMDGSIARAEADERPDIPYDGIQITDRQFPGRFSRVAEPPPWGGIWVFL
jgi:hypothetical protein